MKHKKDLISIFQKFVNLIQTQFSMSIKTLRFDNEGEYISHEFRQFCDSKGIIHETTCPYTPQQNGVSERKNRHKLEIV